ncbi:MAG TPA: cbb3-type cytochrome c oxidase subunit I [Anaerolineae bacterium]|jgi:cytochrome c oxidase subunit 1|nr:cbb3-type cytochrome c oxidase subunit I [Anaerolineae bacterium]
MNTETFFTKLIRFVLVFFSLGLIRGLIGQAVGTAIGFGLVTAVRSAQGLEENADLAVLLGGLLGVILFLLFAGVLSDWLRWARGKETHLRHGPPEHKPAWARYFSVDTNHKVIGIQYTVTAILVLLIGGLLAIIFRIELSYPGMQFLNENQYNTLFSAHGIIMIVSILLGVGGMVNYLVPLMIGAADMAFPRLNAFSYWVAVPAAVLLLLGIAVGGWDTGWVGYPTLSTTSVAIGVQFFILGFYVVGFSSIAGSLNTIITIFTMRARGMGMFRMPIFVWGALAASLIQVTATQTVSIALLMVLVERAFGLSFFDPANGGDPLLYQHLFWFYSHPVVYVFVLPGLGVISELLPVFARKPLFGYRWIALSSIAIALVGFIVWAHHMFVSGMQDELRVVFMFATLLVAVPTGVKFFSWVGTVWQGKLIFPTPMLFVIGAISVFLIGGLTGPILATVPTDMHLHDSYWIVGHFHATMFGGFVFPFFAALYYWFPKATGRMYNESLGKWHFYLMTPAFWVMSLGQMRIGLLGMRRRIADYDPALGVEDTQLLVTLAGLVIGWSVLIMVYNLVVSARSGEVASTNPWHSRSPEWQITSPVPEMNYDRPPVVTGDPYDYSPAAEGYVSVSPASPGD